jgi:uncharacterized protein YjbI with pentapeptide repeats
LAKGEINMNAYKNLCGVAACNGGKFNYEQYLPQKSKPGKWLPVIEHVKACQSGYHLTLEPHQWVGNRVFLCEYSNGITEDNKIVVETFRFLKEITISNCISPQIYIRIADLSGADLIGADLSGADLSGLYLRGANLRGADLRRADLSGANIGGANLREADLSEADLRGADLSGANLIGANFSEAYLRRADLSWSNLRRANLHRADLSEADLSRADLRGANLKESIR